MFERCKDEADVREKLATFYGGIDSNNRWSYFSQWTWRNAIFFGIALLIAFIAWLLFLPQFALVQKKFTIPLEFQNVSSTYVVQDIIPREAVITLQGQNLNFSSLSPQSLQVIVDLAAIKTPGWHEVSISAQNTEIPANFSVVQVEPRSIEIEIGNKTSN